MHLLFFQLLLQKHDWSVNHNTDSGSTLSYTCEGQQGDEVYCKRTSWIKLTSSQRGLAHAGNCESETVD